jgi:signal transduction histidine kinase
LTPFQRADTDFVSQQEQPMNPSGSHAEKQGGVSLEAIISTAELTRRAGRSPDHRAENRALNVLAQEMVTSPDRILQKLAETAMKLCHAGSSGISLLNSKGDFYWPAVTGSLAAHLGGGTPREFGPCGTVLDRNAPQLMSHPERHFSYLESLAPSIEEVLLVPFYIDGKAVGTIWVISHEPQVRFDAEDLRMMTNLATFAAAAYQTLQNQSHLRQALKAQQVLQSTTEETIKQRTEELGLANQSLLAEILERTQTTATLRALSGRLLQAQDDERRRIARELHDSTGQVLAALRMNLSAMQPNSSPENSIKYSECIELIESASAEIRNLSYLLHPPMMDELGLRAAVTAYAQGFEGRSGLKILVDVSENVGRLEGNREIVLFRVIQECLSNIHRHSGSSTACIRIMREQKDVVMEIVDQGHGLERGEDGKFRSGVGLRGMEERIRPLDGIFSIESSVAGTSVRVVLPNASSVVQE